MITAQLQLLANYCISARKKIIRIVEQESSDTQDN